MEQKLVCYSESESRKSNFLVDMIKQGWRIKEISASSHGTENVCWVLFERSAHV